MSEATHTPGPWHVTPINGQPFVRNSESRNVCSLVTTATGCGNVKNDAALIAAAPDLLAALEALFAECVMVHRFGGSADNTQAAAAAEAAARAAIAAATGKA